jgi:hypothetical protein
MPIQLGDDRIGDLGRTKGAPDVRGQGVLSDRILDGTLKRVRSRFEPEVT